MEKVDKRVKDALKEVAENLPDSVFRFCKEKNIKIAKFNNSEFGFHHLNGCVSQICPDIIQLNYFNIDELSKKAIKGVIVHELGHSYIIYRQDWFSNIVLKFLNEFQKKRFEEKRADQLVKKWGFQKDLDSLKKESVFKKVNCKNDGSINVYEESKKINDDERRVDIYLKCNKCKMDYKIEYFYFDNLYSTNIFFIRKEKSKGEMNFDYPITYQNIIKSVGCLDCEGELKVIRIDKNPNNNCSNNTP